MPGLFIDEVSGAELFYHARIAIMPTDRSPPAQLIVEAQPRSLAHGIGFAELLLAGDDAVARKAQRYARARYVDGLLVERSEQAIQPQHWRKAQEPSGEHWYTNGGYEFLAKAVGNRTIMVLGLPQHDIIDRATTFSYLFTLFGLLALLATAVHLVATRKLPSLGIGSKVRAALVLFAIIGLVFFGIGSQHLLSRQFAQRAEAASLEKARSVQSELQRRIGDEHIADDVHATYLEHMCEQLGSTFFTDITVYAPDGRLLASSRPQMFTSGLLGERMDPVAFARLALDGAQAFVHEELIGSAAFSTAYAPLLDSHGEILAHIALPRFADQLQQEEERAELLVAVVNLFVLLFALSVLLAVFISNWTTQPLDVLKRALAGVALRGANEPIRYRGRDEVGELVAVYNRKVEELRESAERLARSERESAWREMARQVAHEIKNPLTPMDSVLFTLNDSVTAGVEVIIEDSIIYLACMDMHNGSVNYQLNYENDFALPAQVYILDDKGAVCVNDSLSAGDYCLFVEDRNGCLANSVCFSVKNPDTIQVIVSSTPQTCTSGGTVSVLVTGGNGQYQFDWSDLPGSDDPMNRSNLEQGTYTLTITDDCFTVIKTVVIENTCTDTCNLLALATPLNADRPRQRRGRC